MIFTQTDRNLYFDRVTLSVFAQSKKPKATVKP